MRAAPPLLLLLLLAGVARAAPSQYIGAEACKACHPLAYESWSAGPHARAAELLPQGRRGDPRCTSCHAPDADKGGGGVSCETCHGGGRVYAHPYVMRDRELARALGLVADPGPRSCLACHTESAPTLAPFDYEKLRRVVEHAGDRAARRRPPPDVRGAE